MTLRGGGMDIFWNHMLVKYERWEQEINRRRELICFSQAEVED